MESRAFHHGLLGLRRHDDQGFSLFTALLVVLLMTSLVIFLHFQVVAQWRIAESVESQLYSLVLAENGIEYARTILPHLDLTALLRGVDEIHSGTGLTQWRNPMTFSEARSIDPATWNPSCDDGLPFHQGALLLPKGYAAEGGGYFFLRCSNNPEELPDQDEDYVALVRSLGVVPNLIRDPFLPGINNSFALVEARFRQERTFSLPSPLTLFGNSGSFQWESDLFSIEGDNQFGVSVVSFSPPSLQQSFLGSLSAKHQGRIRGSGPTPSVRDATSAYLSKKIYEGLFRPEFWRHFETQLPTFVDAPPGRIAFLPEGGALDTEFRGVLVARGNLTLQGQARIKGLLLHLGGGTLTLQDAAQVVGGVWMSNLDSSGTVLQALPISLRVRGPVKILFSATAVQSALACFPPTQLGWRILFPEMRQ